jgi:hypothetical protein
MIASLFIWDRRRKVQWKRQYEPADIVLRRQAQEDIEPITRSPLQQQQRQLTPNSGEYAAPSSTIDVELNVNHDSGEYAAPSSTYDVEQARLASEQEAFEEERNISFVFKLRQAAKLGFSKKSGITPSMSHTKAFSVLDKDGSGGISVSELKAALVKEGSSEVLEAEIQSLIDQVDVSGDGELQLDEFETFWDLFKASFEESAAPKQTTARSRAASLQTDGTPTRELTRECNRLLNPALDPEAAAVEAQAEEHARRTAGAGVGFEHQRELRQPPPSHLPPPSQVTRTSTRTKQRRSTNELEEEEVELEEELRLAREDRLEIARDRKDRLEIAKEKATRKELAARQTALGHEAYKVWLRRRLLLAWMAWAQLALDYSASHGRLLVRRRQFLARQALRSAFGFWCDRCRTAAPETASGVIMVASLRV